MNFSYHQVSIGNIIQLNIQISHFNEFQDISHWISHGQYEHRSCF